MKRSRFLKVLAGISILPSAIMAISVDPSTPAVIHYYEGFTQAEMEMFKRLIHNMRKPVWARSSL